MTTKLKLPCSAKIVSIDHADDETTRELSVLERLASKDKTTEQPSQPSPQGLSEVKFILLNADGQRIGTGRIHCKKEDAESVLGVNVSHLNDNMRMHQNPELFLEHYTFHDSPSENEHIEYSEAGHVIHKPRTHKDFLIQPKWSKKLGWNGPQGPKVSGKTVNDRAREALTLFETETPIDPALSNEK